MKFHPVDLPKVPEGALRRMGEVELENCGDWEVVCFGGT